MNEDVEILAALAQHYGVLTRMIDWSFNLYVALYFACTGVARKRKCENDSPTKNMVIWALNHKKLLSAPEQRERRLHLVVPPYAYNPNLNAQYGVLAYFESPFRSAKEDSQLSVDRRPLDELIAEYYSDVPLNPEELLYRIELTTKCAKEIYDFVDKSGYNAAPLFPGYKGIAMHMEERSIMYNNT